MNVMSSSKYTEIFGILQKELCDGKYGAHNLFPSEAQLVRRFHVSRFTAVRAVRKLEDEGLIVRRKGKGSFPTKFIRSAYGPIGLIMPGLADGEIFVHICDEITRLCQRKGRTVLLGNATAEAQNGRQEAARKLAFDFVRQHVAGVIMHPTGYVRDASAVNREMVSIFDKAGVPIVLLGYDIEPASRRYRYDLVAIDNFLAGRRLGEHLVSGGVRKVLFVTRKNCTSTVEDRMMGIATAMLAAGLPWSSDCIVEAESTSPGSIMRLLHGKDAPDAVVCGCDLYSVSVLKAIEKVMRKSVLLGDIKLAGFDNVRCSSVATPSLTSIRQPCKELAHVAVEMLYRRMEHPDRPVCTALLDAPLVVREYAASAAGESGT